MYKLFMRFNKNIVYNSIDKILYFLFLTRLKIPVKNVIYKYYSVVSTLSLLYFYSEVNNILVNC